MNRIIILIILFFPGRDLLGQDLLEGLRDTIAQNEKVRAAFKSTRVINAHSLEMLAKGNLDFRILHRFDPVNAGFFGLDAAKMRMAFDYGLTQNLMIGVGRSTYRKEVDGFAKVRLVQQSRGAKSFPLSILLAAGTTIYNDNAGLITKPEITDRTAYYLQLIAGRKFSSNFSLQFSPIVVHRNMVDATQEDNTTLALGGGARYKLNKRFAVTVDYHHPLSRLSSIIRDPLSIGIDIETGGHVFQLHFSNAVGMNERAYITETTDKFFNGDIRFGFNLSRMFKLRKGSQ